MDIMTGMKRTKRCMKRVAVSMGSHMLSRRRASILADIERSNSEGEKMVGLMECEAAGGHGIKVDEESMEGLLERGAKQKASPPANGINQRRRGRRGDRTRVVAKKRAERPGIVG